MFKQLFITFFCLLILFAEPVSASKRSRKMRRRWYRAGYLDPVEMYKNNRTFTAQDARKGTLERGEDLPPIEWYDNTLWVFEHIKKIEREKYKKEDIEAYDSYCNNMTDTSKEMYDLYVSSPNNGDYIFKNTSYVIIFGNKDDQKSIFLC